MQSILLLFIYLMNNCELPWSSFLDCSNFHRNLKTRLNLNKIRELISFLPREFLKIANQIFRLDFKEDPPYEEFKTLLLKIMRKLRSDEEKIENFKFDWIKNQATLK